MLLMYRCCLRRRREYRNTSQLKFQHYHPFVEVPCWLWLNPFAFGLIHKVSDSKKLRPDPSSTLHTGTATKRLLE